MQVALDRLPGNYATALELKYVDGCSVAEIATRLDLNGIATQSLLARAGDWSQGSGDVYTELPRADLRELRRHAALAPAPA